MRYVHMINNTNVDFPGTSHQNPSFDTFGKPQHINGTHR